MPADGHKKTHQRGGFGTNAPTAIKTAAGVISLAAVLGDSIPRILDSTSDRSKQELRNDTVATN
jgi:hypothetical protein